ncbi:hypothetical protein I7007_001315 [Campylobacter jejuni]|nr:hypothetical protein [Campylobacter jejuni]EDP2897596.1 hypothetical protein [Campylobacter jejuni]EGR9265331.1 hypothetical protein [Campylobacter jejuni]
MDLKKLSNEEREELEKIYNSLKNLYKEKADLEVLKKNREEQLKDEIANVCDIRNKAGEALGKNVKMPLVMAIIEEIKLGKPNKKDIEADTMDTYRKAIKSNEVNKEVVNDFVTILDEIKENQLNIKEVFKDCNVLSREVLSAVDLLIKDKYKEIKEDAMSKAGYDLKPPKDKADILSIKTQLEDILE